MIAALLLAVTTAADPCTTPNITVAEQVKAEREADCAKAKAKAKAEKPPPVPFDWFVPVSVGRFNDANFLAGGVGVKKGGVQVMLQAMAGRQGNYGLSGIGVTSAGCEIPVTMRVPGETKYGLSVGVIIPLR